MKQDRMTFFCIRLISTFVWLVIFVDKCFLIKLEAIQPMEQMTPLRKHVILPP